MCCPLYPFKVAMHSIIDTKRGVYMGKAESVVKVRTQMEIFERERTTFQSARVVLMGDSGVGKSAIVARYLYGDYREYHERTVEDFHSQTFLVGKVLLQLDMIDTTGSYIFPAMRRVAISRGDVFVLVYSIDDFNSYQEVLKLQKEIADQRAKRNYSVVVVGNKLDLQEKRAVAPDEAEMMSCGAGEEFLETSAREDVNLDLLFEKIFYQCVRGKDTVNVM